MGLGPGPCGGRHTMLPAPSAEPVRVSGTAVPAAVACACSLRGMKGAAHVSPFISCGRAGPGAWSLTCPGVLAAGPEPWGAGREQGRSRPATGQ